MHHLQATAAKKNQWQECFLAVMRFQKSFVYILLLGCASVLVAGEPRGVSEPVREGGRPRPSTADAFERETKARAHIAEADRLRAIYARDPNKAKMPDTRRLEAKALLEAARAGDVTQEKRLVSLIDVVRRDAALPEAKRCEIVGMRQYQQAKLGRIRNEKDRLAAIERIERSLIEEFPAAPNGYEALYRLALHCDDAKGRALAEELVAMPKAPDFVKLASRKLLNRYSLIGRPLAELLPGLVKRQGAGGNNLLPGVADPSSGKYSETVLYCWTSTNRGSIAFAQFLQRHAPPDLQCIGVCIDNDGEAGRGAAQAAGLRNQLYDPTGELTSRLMFEGTPMALIADRDGMVRTISGVRELTRRLAPARSAHSETSEGR